MKFKTFILIYLLALMFYFLLTFCFVHAAPKTNFYGTISLTDSNVIFVRWTNTPSIVIVQHSSNMSNWFDVLYIAKMYDNSNFSYFEYSLNNNPSNSLFVRLRSL